MNSSESIKELASALSRAQSKMKTADKGSVNPHFKSKYASLEEVWDACREALTSEGLSVIQGVTSSPSDTWYLETKLMHCSGEWTNSYTPLFLPSPANMQHLGSAVTYAKRISLMAIAGISVGEADDDGEQNRAAVESDAQRKKDEAAAFKRHEATLRYILKEEALPQEKLLEYAKARVSALGIKSVDFLASCVDDKQAFLDEYREFTRV